MGLRINTNLAAMSAQRQLYSVDNRLNSSLSKLSSGLRITKASDDPSGLVMSEDLRAQIKSVGQALQNSQFASNLIGTAEAALSEVNDLLVDIRTSIVFALNKGGATQAQILAEQDSVNQALNAIDRIASSTRFGSRNLLDGSSGFDIYSKDSIFDHLDVKKVQFGNAQSIASFTVNFSKAASRAIIASGGATSTTSIVTINSNNSGSAIQTATIRVTGALGTTDVSLASGATMADLASAINNSTSKTGVYVSFAGGSYQYLSTEFGSDQTISIENVTASGAGVILLNQAFGGGATAVQQYYTTRDTGQDVVATIDGANVVGDGWEMNIVSNFLSAEILVSERIDISTQTTATFSVLNNINSGLTFQLGDGEVSSDRISLGIRSISTSELGKQVTAENTSSSAAANTNTLSGGFLTSLRSGSTNDLLNNPENALKIVDEAIDQVSNIRAYLGSIQSDTIDRNISALSIHQENLSASESTIRDLDFAEETVNFTKLQIQFQAATSVLASANMIPQSVLTLLGG